jgi:hypothetical protein
MVKKYFFIFLLKIFAFKPQFMYLYICNMPNGILIIIMPATKFKTARTLASKAKAYFSFIEGEYSLETKTGKEQKVYSREPEPATITGLALFLGFNSRQELDDYEKNGEFGHVISRSRLRVENVYEKKLLKPSPMGAVFALKNMARRDKTEDHREKETRVSTIGVEVFVSGPKPAGSEAEVVT